MKLAGGDIQQVRGIDTEKESEEKKGRIREGVPVSFSSRRKKEILGPFAEA